MKTYTVLAVACLLSLCLSCAHRSGHLPRNTSSEETTAQNSQTTKEKEPPIKTHAMVKMVHQDGVYYVPITVNGLNLRFIFDTGASNVCISSAEALVMMRQKLITQNDVVGQEQFQDANGDISVGTIIRLRDIEIGGIVLHDIEATVVDNMNAPLLLGQTALSKFGKVSIDYEKDILEFN